ncbi:large conductance mechanosensitive channel protein MscL [soil metagenome]
MIGELKAFLLRGNVIDLAVAVVIGVAFTAIVTALVERIINPLIGLIFGQADLSALTLTIGGGASEDATVFGFGIFINAIINFVLVGTVLFLVVKAANRAMEVRKGQVEVKQSAPEIPEDVALLREIRDALTARP